MALRLGFTFERGRRAAFFIVLTLVLVAAFAGTGEAVGTEAAEGSGEAEGSGRDLPEGQFRLTQRLSMTMGTLRGDRQAFLRHEGDYIPGLNPRIEVEGSMDVKTWLTPDLQLRLQTTFAEDGQTIFGIGGREWDVQYGSHSFTFAPAGLAHTKSSEGWRLRFRQPEGTGGIGLLVARSKARAGEATIRGDDTFGPFFLGQKRIVAGSERVVVDGKTLQRGDRPGDGDYSIDYDGGFIYFHTVLLIHETAHITFQYSFDDPALASRFIGALGAHTAGDTTVRTFALRDEEPAEEHPIVERPGSVLLAYGADVETTWPAGIRLKNTVVVTDLREHIAATKTETDSWTAADGRLVYTLKRWPVLYESERVVVTLPGEPPYELIRHLHYTLDYHNGELTLHDEVAPGGTLAVKYAYVDRGQSVETAFRQGMETKHRLEYAGERWRAASWVNVVGGEYVDVNSRAEPEERLAAGTEVRYGLGGGWGVLGDVAVTEGRMRRSVGGAVGLDYRRDRWETWLQWGRNVETHLEADIGRDGATGGAGAAEATGATGGAAAFAPEVAATAAPSGDRTTFRDFVRGGLRWRGAIDVTVDFTRPVGAYSGGVPERLNASVAGRFAALPFSVAYTRGHRHYKDMVEGRLTLPVTGTNAKGGVTLGTRLLYEDGFAQRPRTVHSVTGEMTYSGPTGVYARGRLTGSLSGGEATAMRTYTLQGDVGYGFGPGGVIDYQLRIDGRRTVYGGRGTSAAGAPQPRASAPGRLTEGSGSVAHLVTLAFSLTEKTRASVAWRHTDGAAEQRTVVIDTGWQATLQHNFGSLQGTLSYDTSRAGSAGDRPPTTVDRIRLGLGWEKGPLSIDGTFEHTLYDKNRLRRNVQVAPSYDLSDSTRISFTYDYIVSQAVDPTGRPKSSADDYEAHTGQVGVTVRF